MRWESQYQVVTEWHFRFWKLLNCFQKREETYIHTYMYIHIHTYIWWRPIVTNSLASWWSSVMWRGTSCLLIPFKWWASSVNIRQSIQTTRPSQHRSVVVNFGEWPVITANVTRDHFYINLYTYILYYIILYYIISSFIILYCIMLYYIILYYLIYIFIHIYYYIYIYIHKYVYIYLYIPLNWLKFDRSAQKICCIGPGYGDLKKISHDCLGLSENRVQQNPMFFL